MSTDVDIEEGFVRADLLLKAKMTFPSEDPFREHNATHMIALLFQLDAFAGVSRHSDRVVLEPHVGEGIFDLGGGVLEPEELLVLGQRHHAADTAHDILTEEEYDRITELAEEWFVFKFRSADREGFPPVHPALRGRAITMRLATEDECGEHGPRFKTVREDGSTIELPAHARASLEDR